MCSLSLRTAYAKRPQAYGCYYCGGVLRNSLIGRLWKDLMWATSLARTLGVRIPQTPTTPTAVPSTHTAFFGVDCTTRWLVSVVWRSVPPPYVPSGYPRLPPPLWTACPLRWALTWAYAHRGNVNALPLSVPPPTVVGGGKREVPEMQ